MAGAFEEDFVLRAAVDAERDLVGHGARGHEQSGLVAEERRDMALQLVDRRILAEHVIAHGRGVHRREHRGRGPGHRVAAEVDHGGAL